VAIGRPKSSVRDRLTTGSPGIYGRHRQHENATAVEYETTCFSG
jgi:hypothetical protein